jgi:hypothetical protein
LRDIDLFFVDGCHGGWWVGMSWMKHVMTDLLD